MHFVTSEIFLVPSSFVTTNSFTVFNYKTVTMNLKLKMKRNMMHYAYTLFLELSCFVPTIGFTVFNYKTVTYKLNIEFSTFETSLALYFFALVLFLVPS